LTGLSVSPQLLSKGADLPFFSCVEKNVGKLKKKCSIEVWWTLDAFLWHMEPF
jgi:hypothetical protein